MASRSWLLRLYGIATQLAQPLLRRKLSRRAQAEPGYAHAVPERFGHYDEQLTGNDWCWIHAVSLGEARAAAILVDELRAQAPGVRILLTNGTATGREEGAKLLREGDLQVWQPWDTPDAVARFLDRFAPRIGVLMETEVWPELAAGCAERGIPLVLANARMSEKSRAGAQRFAWLARPAYASLAAVWAQTEADAHRLVSLGAKVEGVFGNLKFDAAPDPRQLANAQTLRPKLPQPVVMFASSRDGEERLLLEVLSQFWAESPVQPVEGVIEPVAKPVATKVSDVQWMIVPRHPQRFDEVAALAESMGFAVARRSTAGEPRKAEAEIWLGDSLGEMALYYGLADVALLGGSFEPLGGQNLIEAAACGCPVVMGPSTFNFAEAADLALAAGAASRVEDLEQAVAAAVALVAEPARRETMSQAALNFAASNRGAVHSTAAAVLALAATRGAAPPEAAPATAVPTLPEERPEPRLE